MSEQIQSIDMILYTINLIWVRTNSFVVLREILIAVLSRK
jgi:hypothetical protein